MNILNTSNPLFDPDFIAEKKEWANTYGSDVLKLAIANNDSTNLRYFDERISIEYPGFSFIKLNWVTRQSNTTDRTELEAKNDTDSISPEFPVFLVLNAEKVDSPSSVALRESLKYPGSYVASFFLLPVTSNVQREILIVDDYLGVCQIAKIIENKEYKRDLLKRLISYKNWKSFFS